MTTPNGITDKPRVLFVSNLYPNPGEPTRGIFNQHTAHALAEHAEVRVLAVVPWYPGSGSMKGIPETLDDDGVKVHYVRAFYTPVVLRNLHGEFFRRSIRRSVGKIRTEFPFDMLYGSWVYPDGYGVTLLSQELGVPCVLHALGSDIHRRLLHPSRRRKVVWALSRAGHVICVSQYLRDHIVKAGVAVDRVSVVYDGVDTALFSSRDRRTARTRLGLPLEPRIILFVGSLRPIKGPEHLIDAIGKLKVASEADVHLVMLGTGPLEKQLRTRVRRMGLDDRLKFPGARPHEEVPHWMSAADLLCLPSLDEGLPNVVLEALASGTPVVASDVGGVSEAINSSDLGILVRPGDSEALAVALREGLARRWDTDKLVARASQFSWQQHGARIAEILREVAVTSGG